MSERKIDEATMDNVEILAKTGTDTTRETESYGRDGKKSWLMWKS